MQTRRDYWIRILAYLAVYIGWGTTYLAIRIGVQSLGPASFLGLRFILSAILLVPVVLLQRTDFRSITVQEISHSSLLGVMLLGAGLLPLSYAEKTMPSNIAAIIIGCAPATFAIFDRLINGTPIRKPVVIGFILGIIGISLLGTGGGSAVGQVTAFGLALVIGGSLCWTFASVVSKRMRPVRAPMMHILVQYTAVGIALLVFAALFEGLSLETIARCSPEAWKSLVYIAVFPSLISYTAYMWLLKHEPSARVSTYAFVNPVVAVIAGALVLGESTSPAVIGALALVIAGTGVNFWGRGKKT